MLYKKIISAGTSGILMTSCFVSIPKAKASPLSYECINSFDSVDENERTAGLITQYHCGVTNTGGSLSLSAWTISGSTMSTIGLKNISVQRSSTGTSWTEEKTLSDMVKTNSKKYTVSNSVITVHGGYYYRIVCDHYADNGSGTTQSVSNTSNSVWIS